MGTIPVEKELLMIWVKGVEMSSITEFIIVGSIPFKPELCVVFSDRQTFMISEGDVGIIANELGLGLIKYALKDSFLS